MSLIRYPGSKSRLISPILEVFSISKDKPVNYVEPFFGAGSVGIAIAEFCHPDSTIVVSDLDVGIVCLWQAVRDGIDDLCEKIYKVSPSVSLYEECKELDGDISEGKLVCGLRKLILHQLSYSGIGYKSGGPLGGKLQKSSYKVDCRWSPKRLEKNARKLNNTMKRVKSFDILCQDAFETIDSCPDSAIMYLDPPYFVKGGQLYRYGFSEEHLKLTEKLKTLKCRWVLSYDDCPEIREMYKWAKIIDISAWYSVGGSNKTNELIILPR